MQYRENCCNCGNENNDFLINYCLSCNSWLDTVQPESIADETIVILTSEWVGRIGGDVIQQNENANIWKSVANKIGKEQFGRIPKFKNTGYLEIDFQLINETSIKYLNILKDRSIKNPALVPIYHTLNNEYIEKNKSINYKFGKLMNWFKNHRFLTAFIIIISALILIPTLFMLFIFSIS